jgi:hypothetical protein
MWPRPQLASNFPFPSSLYPVWLTPLSGHAAAVGDLSNDGSVDMFLNFGGSTTVAWIAYGHGDGTFGLSVDQQSASPDLSIPVPFNGGPVAWAT